MMVIILLIHIAFLFKFLFNFCLKICKFLFQLKIFFLFIGLLLTIELLFIFKLIKSNRLLF